MFPPFNFYNNIPNMVTCMNLICGCLAVMMALKGELSSASAFILLGAAFDFADGFVARMLKTQSEIGKQLDSLADMVTFGLAPGMIVYYLASTSNYSMGNSLDIYLPFAALIIPVFSAVRLAKFNIDPRQSDSFIGLPTPANALFFCSFPLILGNSVPDLNFPAENLLQNPVFLAGLSVFMSLLLVSEIPLFSLKFKNFTWSDNKTRFLFTGISVFFLVIMKYLAMPLIIILYVLVSVIDNKLKSRIRE